MTQLIITNQPVLKVGTDCSGIEAPIQALRQLAIPFHQVFSCDVDKFCQQSIKENYYCDKLYTDITTRNHADVPDMDLYVAGWPCQAFSTAGNRQGFAHKSGNIFWHCLDVIKIKKPRYFLMENVKGLTWHDKGRTWKIIRESLENLDDYNFHWKVLNTRDYGIPQNRERIYMVGIRKDLKQTFEWPKPVPMKPLSNFVDWDYTVQDEIRPDVIKSGMLNNIPKDAIFVDFSFKKHNYPNSGKYCPTVAADSRLWCVPLHRYATPGERLALQGFNSFYSGSPARQINKQAGNSMSVNVLSAILTNLL